ncbi:MAG: hypothetical protein GF317_19600 [Candidatus Lokiarchaeota archaeon]|nr:hypothetical protein [Candidatus Lokiarchaeota archaeon]MBD3201702.1 hypothetical protein [Candidatus Lokiarchaeota archaeon]
MKILNHPQAKVYIGDLKEDMKSITVKPIKSDIFIPIKSCITHYSFPLIEKYMK